MVRKKSQSSTPLVDAINRELSKESTARQIAPMNTTPTNASRRAPAAPLPSRKKAKNNGKNVSKGRSASKSRSKSKTKTQKKKKSKGEKPPKTDEFLMD